MTLPNNANRPPKVDDRYLYWELPPPELSPRCLYWIEQIYMYNWRPNKHRRREGYDYSSALYGVYIWEYINVLCPLLDLMKELDLIKVLTIHIGIKP